MSRESRIRENLEKALAPTLLEIENESHMHSGPASESHYKVLVVSEAFAGQSRLQRQRLVNDLLSEELQSGMHALTQKTLTPDEFAQQKDSLNFISPECRGGSKRAK